MSGARLARHRWENVGAAIPHDTDNLRDAIKREIWTRGLTITDIAARVGMNLDYLERVLSRRGNSAGRFQALHPPLLNRLIAAIHITPAVARRLHLLAAREAGWKV